MKILFLSAGGPSQDYMRDCVFRGFRELFGPDVVDINKLESMYVGADRSQMYGKGMTLYSELPDVPVDREDIPRKIATKYFDLVVYGSIHRCHDYLHEVASMCDPRKVIFIDGEDHPGYLKGLGGLYFKRELNNPQPGVFPIQFTVPKEKILKSAPCKSRLMAPMDPLDKTTYIYETEADYYAQYASSYYAPTMKKSGWDCLRHYEILSQWCIPYFRVLDQCPASIMVHLPKRELRLVQELVDNRMWVRDSVLETVYEDLIDPIMLAVEQHLTTEALATYILDTARSS